MVLLQLGFLEAVKITATNNFEHLDFDIVLLSPRYEQFYAAGFFPLDRLTERGMSRAWSRLRRCMRPSISGGAPPTRSAKAEPTE